MLIEGQEFALLHRHSAPGDRMSVDHAVDIRAGHMDRAGDRIAKPPLLTSSSDGSTLFPSTSILTSDEAVISSYSMPKRLIRKWSCGPGTRAVMRVLIRSDQPNRSTRR